jgi:hypothetical protein
MITCLKFNFIINHEINKIRDFQHFLEITNPNYNLYTYYINISFLYTHLYFIHLVK